MLTTTDDPREVERCYGLGCDVYITKPVEYEQFVEAIKQLGLFLRVVLGIGLTLVRQLVELHGGGVEARSDGIGAGSELLVRLPSLGAPGLP